MLGAWIFVFSLFVAFFICGRVKARTEKNAERCPAHCTMSTQWRSENLFAVVSDHVQCPPPNLILICMESGELKERRHCRRWTLKSNWAPNVLFLSFRMPRPCIRADALRCASKGGSTWSRIQCSARSLANIVYNISSDNAAVSHVRFLIYRQYLHEYYGRLDPDYFSSTHASTESFHCHIPRTDASLTFRWFLIFHFNSRQHFSVSFPD